MSVNAGQAQTRRTRACHATWYWVGSAFTLTRKRPFKSGTRRSELSLRVRDQVRHRRQPAARADAVGRRWRTWSRTRRLSSDRRVPDLNGRFRVKVNADPTQYQVAWHALVLRVWA